MPAVDASARQRRRPIDTAWAALPLLLPAFVLLLGRMRAIDLAYHVRLGELMLDTGSIVRTDPLTFSAEGSRWLDQQWFAQILLAVTHRIGGWEGVWVLRALLAGVAFGLLSLACRRRGASVPAASMLTIGGFVLAYVNLGMRPQMLAVTLFCLALWAVAGRKDHPARLVALPIAALVVANVHGSFPLFVLLGVLAAGEDLVDRDPAWRRTAVFAGVTLLATFVTPSGPGAWGYVVDISTDPQIRDTVTEWAPLRITEASGALTVASALALVTWLLRRGETIAWRDLLWLGLFLVPAFVTQRSAVWWAIVLPVVVAGLLPRSTEGADARRGSAMPARIVIAALVAGIVLALPWFRGLPDDAILDDAPPGLTAAVAGQLAPGTRLFVHQAWASWFEYATPTIPVFVDSRIELFPPPVWDAYDQVAFAGAGWVEALERWDVEAIVADDEWALLPRLREDPAWRVAYEDEDGALLVRV